jgi:hypothetical protein
MCAPSSPTVLGLRPALARRPSLALPRSRALCVLPFWVLALCALAPLALSAQVDCGALGPLGAGPALIRDDGGSIALGIRARGELCRSGVSFRPSFPRSWQAGLKLDASVPARDLRIPQNVEVGAHAGGYLSLFRLGEDSDWDRGIVGAAVRVSYEADRGFEEQALSLGADLRFVDVLRSYLPSLVFTFDLVRPVRSEVRDSLDADRESHRRFEGRAYWYHAFQQTVFVELDAGWFRAWGLGPELEEVGFREGGYLAPGAGYLLDAPLPGGLRLRSLFLGYAHGQRPTGTRSEKAWSVGVEVGGGG